MIFVRQYIESLRINILFFFSNVLIILCWRWTVRYFKIANGH